MIDFELATKQAYEELFPGITVRGCLFHFGQNLFKNLMKCGLKQEYMENPELRKQIGILVQKRILLIHDISFIS